MDAERQAERQTSSRTAPKPGPSWNTRGWARSRPGAAAASAGRLSSISGTAEWYGKCRLPDMLHSCALLPAIAVALLQAAHTSHHYDER